MKYVLVAVALVGCIALVRGDDKSDSPTEALNSTALFSGVFHVNDDLEIFTNQQLEKSFDFLLLSSIFNKHDMDRPGFEKLYRKISDKAWEDTQGLIKYRSKRGLFTELNGLQDSNLKNLLGKPLNRGDLLASEEMSSLKLALAYETKLAEESHRIHKKISHAHNTNTGTQVYDPDVAHYLDEEIIEYQSGVIRDLAGYIHILQPIKDDKAVGDLGLHLFDEYLAKAL